MVQKTEGTAPHQRFRHEQWAPGLESTHGIRLEFEPFESNELTSVLYERGKVAQKAFLTVRDAIRRWGARHRVHEFDGVVVLREAMLLGGAWLENAIVRRGVPLIYDFDDAIWQVDVSGRNGVATLARMPWKVGSICRIASAVTVGNDYLAAFARRHSRNVHIVRTSIDESRFHPSPMPDPDPFTVVWTGSHSTLRHLDIIRPALEQVAAVRRLRLRVVCDVPPAPFDRVELDFRPWSAEREATDLAAGHVGVMPLPDTPFTRGKCGCKALQYMAIGRPAIVSPVGINTEIVEHGVNGLVANGTGEWVQQLEALAHDRDLCARLGEAGRRTVHDGFTTSASAAAFARVARQVAGVAQRCA